MLILPNEDCSIVLKLANAVSVSECPIVVAYGDSSSFPIIEGLQLSESNGTSDVEICSAPATGSRRIIKNISFFNSDSSAVQLSILLDDGSNQFLLDTATLYPGQRYTTDGKQREIYSDESASYYPAWLYFDVDYTDLNGTAASSKQLTIQSMDAGWYVFDTMIQIKTGFQGGAIATMLGYLMQSGNAITSSMDWYTHYANVNFRRFVFASNIKQTHATSAWDLIFYIVATGANLTALTQGSARIGYRIAFFPLVY